MTCPSREITVLKGIHSKNFQNKTDIAITVKTIKETLTLISRSY